MAVRVAAGQGSVEEGRRDWGETGREHSTLPWHSACTRSRGEWGKVQVLLLVVWEEEEQEEVVV